MTVSLDPLSVALGIVTFVGAVTCLGSIAAAACASDRV